MSESTEIETDVETIDVAEAVARVNRPKRNHAANLPTLNPNDPHTHTERPSRVHKGRPRVYPPDLTKAEFVKVYNAIQRRRALAEIVKQCGVIISYCDAEFSTFDTEVCELMNTATRIINNLSRSVPKCAENCDNCASNK